MNKEKEVDIFPKWKYHQEKKQDGMIFYSEDEYRLAGHGWVDSPSMFEKVELDPIANESEEIEDFSKLTNKELISKMVNDYGFKIRDIEKNNKAQLIEKLERAIANE